MLFYFNSETEVTKLLKMIGRIYEERTHRPYMSDCHSELPGAHKQDLTECRGIIQHEVDRKNPKLGEFHERVS